MITQQLPFDLLEAFTPLSGKGVICFVGSGPSCHADLPSWADLLYRIGVEIGFIDEIKTHIEKGAFLDVAQFLTSKNSVRDVQVRVARIIKEASNLNGPSKIHDLIVSLPFAGIITTNYDLLLTEADIHRKFDLPITQTTSNLRQQLHERFILHLHGHVNDPDTIILSRSGYDNIQLNGTKIQQFLSSVFQFRVVLFIGFGFADNHIEEMLRNFQDSEVIGSSDIFALIPITSSDAVIEEKLRYRLINPIYLNDNGDHGVNEIISWLENLKKSTDRIFDSNNNSVVKLYPQDLIEKLKNLIISNDVFPLLGEALLTLPFRPDLWFLVDGGLTKAQTKGLLTRLSSSEMRLILVYINNILPNPDIQDALSCFPP